MMRICQVELRNFRGIQQGKVVLPKHAVLLGANNVGKSTVVEALALLFGRERMVRPISDWDFFGGSPKPKSRFYIIATVTDFSANDPAAVPDWFIGENVARPVWWHDERSVLSTETDPPAGTQLATQLALAGRYDDESCEFETVRYFYHGEADPFTDGYSPVSVHILRGVGLFLLSSNREWDKLLSFGSSSLLKVIREYDALPGKVVEEIKKQLRNDVGKIEESTPLSDILKAAAKELQSFLLIKQSGEIVYRPTSLDTFSVLQSLVAHVVQGNGELLPVARHGAGMVSLQAFLLLLAFAEQRRASNRNFILAAEEPELHLHPTLHQRLVHRIRSTSTQSVVTTQSPHVAAGYQPNEVIFIQNTDGQMQATLLRAEPIKSIVTNSVRRLYLIHRSAYLEALMGGIILVPEGTHDYEWLHLWQRVAQSSPDMIATFVLRPITVVPTSDAAIVDSFREVNKTGRVGFICTSQWLTTNYGKNLRRMLASGHLHEIIDFGSLPVFQNADTYPAIFSLSSVMARELTYKRISITEHLNLKGIEAAPDVSIGLSSLTDAPWSLGGIDIVGILTSRELQWGPLRDFGKAYIGTKSGMNDAFVLPRNDAKRLDLEKSLLFPYAHRGEEIGRYRTVSPDSVVIYPYREGLDGNSSLISEPELKKSFPCVHAHLLSFKGQLRKRMDSRRLYATGPDWYRHLRAGSFHYIQPTKLVLKGIAKRPEVGLLQENTAFDGARCPAIILENLNGHHRNYFLGILNSRVLAYFFRRTCPPKLSGYVEFSATALGLAPIRVINFGDQIEKDSHDRMVLLVEQMLLLHERIDSEKAPHAKTAIQRQLAAADREIDELVYKLYGLTEDQIRTVEQDDIGEQRTTREEVQSEISLAP